jgi:hypothetical protein
MALENSPIRKQGTGGLVWLAGSDDWSIRQTVRFGYDIDHIHLVETIPLCSPIRLRLSKTLSYPEPIASSVEPKLHQFEYRVAYLGIIPIEIWLLG